MKSHPHSFWFKYNMCRKFHIYEVTSTEFLLEVQHVQQVWLQEENDLFRPFPKEVKKVKLSIPRMATPKEIPSLVDTSVRTVPKIFWMRTLEVRNKVMETEMN